MAKAYKITVALENESQKQDKQRTTARTVSGEDVESKSSKAKKDKDGITMLAAFDYAKRFAYSEISYQVGMIELRTGQAKKQQQIQFAVDIGKRLFDIGESALTGSLLAGGVGAIVGAAVNVASQVQDLAHTAQTIQTQRTIEGITLGLNSIRITTEGNR